MTARKAAPRKAAPRKSGAAAARARAGSAAGTDGVAAVSRIPANAPQPQDRQQKKTAAQKKAEAAVRAAEANDGYLDVVSCGVALRIPVGGKVPLDAYLVFQQDPETLEELGITPDNAEIAGTRIMLGEEQWAKFRKAGPTIDDFAEIGAQLEAIAGN